MIKRGLHKKLAEVGKIKTGYRGDKITSKGGATFAPPKKFDHFVITTTERDAKAPLDKLRKEVYKLFVQCGLMIHELKSCKLDIYREIKMPLVCYTWS